MNDDSLNRLKELKNKINDNNLSNNEKNSVIAEFNSLMERDSENNKKREFLIQPNEGGKKLMRRNNVKGFVINVAVIVCGTLFSIMTAVIAGLMMIK